LHASRKTVTGICWNMTNMDHRQCTQHFDLVPGTMDDIDCNSDQISCCCNIERSST
jgi:hypothetical protein